MVTSTDTYVGMGILMFLWIASAIANGLALYLLLKTTKKKVADLLLIHICFWEGLGALWKIVNASLALHQKQLSRSLIHSIGGVVVYVSVCQTLICITIDRFLAVKLNFRYRSMVTKHRFYALLPAIWAISTSLGVLCALTSRKVMYLSWIVMDTITTATLVMSYSYIIITVHRQNRIFKRNSSVRSQFKYKIPLCICLTYLIFIFIPDMIINIKSDLPILWFSVVFSINYCSDPLIYVVFSQCERRQKKKLSNISRDADSTKGSNGDREMTVISSNKVQSE